MTTTIVPANSVSAPLFTQQGVGTSPGYSAIDDRRAVEGSFQEGVGGTTDFMVVERGAGPNLSVDITMPAGGWAKVQGDSFAGQGLYTCPTHASTANEAIAAADSSNPRVDTVVLEVLDTTHDASGSNLARVRVLTGTPTSGATLDNRNGAPSLPGSALLLADVLVPASDTTISNSQIRDRRKWARGAFNRIVRAAGSSYTQSSGTAALIDSTNLNPRIECSGNPMEITLRGRISNSAPGATVFTPWLDGATTESLTDALAFQQAANAEGLLCATWTLVPSAGSHKIGFSWRVGGGTTTLLSATGTPIQFEVVEILRQNTPNNATTSG